MCVQSDCRQSGVLPLAQTLAIREAAMFFFLRPQCELTCASRASARVAGSKHSRLAMVWLQLEVGRHWKTDKKLFDGMRYEHLETGLTVLIGFDERQDNMFELIFHSEIKKFHCIGNIRYVINIALS